MIRLYKPDINHQELQAVQEVLESGWWVEGPKTKKFEEKFSHKMGFQYGVVCSNGTAALYLASKLALLVEGLKRAFIPSLSFCATAHAPFLAGLDLEFSDIIGFPDLTIQPNGYNPEDVVIPMHYGGKEALMDQFADAFIIEDACHAIGTQHRNGRGQVACYSFHPVKNIASPNGGMICSNNYHWIEWLRNHKRCGINGDGLSYQWELNLTSNDFNSAIGLAQLEKLDQMQQKRHTLARQYCEELGIEYDPCSSYHLFPILVNNRDTVQQELFKKGIQTGTHYHPIHLLPVYQDWDVHLPVTEKLSKKILILPLYPTLTETEVDHILTEVKCFVSTN